MTDTAFKQTTLGPSRLEPDSLGLSHPSELRRQPVPLQARAQDSVLAGHRVLVSRHMGGSSSWLADNTGSGGGAQAHPEPDVYREIAVARVEQQAGTVLEVRTISVPAGESELFDIALGTWEPAGVGGNTRALVQWDNDDPATANEEVTYQLTQAVAPGGVEDPASGASWLLLRHDYTPVVRPQAAADSSLEASKWSEWPTLEVTLEDNGGARVVHMCISEAPHEHTVPDTATEVTVNGIAVNLAMPIQRPQIEQADGGTYEEHRFGIHRAMAVATRQTARVGPRIAHWTSYTEAGADVDDIEPPGILFGVGTSRISRPGGSSWDADASGWDLLGTGRNPEALRLAALEGCIPVRIRALVQRQAAPDAGRLRFQSTARGWLDVEVPATLPLSWVWVTATGWLEAPVGSDDGYPIMQDSIIVDVGDIAVRYWDVTYGDFPVAVP